MANPTPELRGQFLDYYGQTKPEDLIATLSDAQFTTFLGFLKNMARKRLQDEIDRLTAEKNAIV